MHAWELKEKLIEWTADNSGFEIKREYISLSHIADCPRRIYENYLNGYYANLGIKLKCWKGYQGETDLKERIKKIYPEYIETKEISLFDGLVKGHTDGELFGDLIEIKSFALDGYMPRSIQDISKRIYWQVQAYLNYGSYEKCFLIIESRESGKIIIHEIFRDLQVIARIAEKVNLLVNSVNYKNIPICECGKC